MSVSGSKITVRVANAKTLSPLAGVAVAVSPAVYLTSDMGGSAVSSVTSNGVGDVVCYALPGTYSFTPDVSAGALAIGDQVVNDTLNGSVEDTSAIAALTAQVNAETTRAEAAEALLAPKASPVLTGTPIAPTAPPGTNTTQLATTAFVVAEAAALVNGAPGALDTLKELADALGDDANYATTVANALALKAPLASPAFTDDATINGDLIIGVPHADTTGATDATPAIQAAVDGGMTHLDLLPGGTYLLDSALFLDNLTGATVVIDGHGATLKLGSNLPSCADFTPDTTVQWAIFPGTARGALSGGMVNASSNYSSASSRQSVLVIRNAVVDGQSANRGLVFGNKASVQLDNAYLTGGRALLSWTGYADRCTMRSCHNVSPYGSDSFLFYQITNGDGVLIDSCKSDSAGGVANLKQCHGGTIRAPISGAYKFTQCRGIDIVSPHVEQSQSGYTTAAFTINNSQVMVNGGEIWLSGSYSPFTISDDTGATGFTTLDLRGCNVGYVLTAPGSDVSFASFVRLNTVNNSTTVRALGLVGFLQVVGSTSTWSQYPPLLSAADSTIDAAIQAAAAQVATGSFRYHQRNNAAEITGYDVPLLVSRKTTVTTLSTVDADQNGITGTLTPGTYEYVVAQMDALGNYGTATAALSATTAAGSIRLQGVMTSTPCRLAVWRKAGTGVSTAPDAYAIIASNGVNFRLFDTGANLNGVPWVSTSVPVPNTVAATNHTADAMIYPAGQVAYAPIAEIVKGSSEARASTIILAADTDLVATLDQNAIYEVACVVRYEAGAAGGITIGFTVPAGASGVWAVDGLASSVSGSTSGVIDRSSNTWSGTVALGSAGATTPTQATIRGYLKTSSSGGTFALKWAQTASSGTNTTVMQYSRIKLERVG